MVDIAESSAVNVLIDEKVVPIKKEVSFGCEMLGLDPFNLVNEGKMVIVVAPEQTNETIVQLRQHQLGRETTVIGTVQQPAQSSQGRLIMIKDQVERVIDRLEGRILPRLC